MKIFITSLNKVEVFYFFTNIGGLAFACKTFFGVYMEYNGFNFLISFSIYRFSYFLVIALYLYPFFCPLENNI